MPRQLKRRRPYIVIFCRGENERVYANFLKKEFKGATSIKRPSSIGLFEEADSKFRKDKSYRDYAETTNEIWPLSDVETKDARKWDNRLRVVKRLCSLREKSGIKVRLLMTTGYVEYRLVLYCKMSTLPIQTVAEKERIIARLVEEVLDYQKEDLHPTSGIAYNYPKAVKNSKRTLSSLLQDGLLSLDDTDERNYWPCRNYLAFSNIYKAIDFLTNLQ